MKGRVGYPMGLLSAPQTIAIWEGTHMPYALRVTASINGLTDGVTLCGVVYFNRNGQDYQYQTFCLTGTEERRLILEHVFTKSDAPSVTWTAYAC